MFNKKIKLKLTDFECNLLWGGMNEFRNMLLSDGIPTKDVDELLLKIINKSERYSSFGKQFKEINTVVSRITKLSFVRCSDLREIPLTLCSTQESWKPRVSKFSSSTTTSKPLTETPMTLCIWKLRVKGEKTVLFLWLAVNCQPSGIATQAAIAEM